MHAVESHKATSYNIDIFKFGLEESHWDNTTEITEQINKKQNHDIFLPSRMKLSIDSPLGFSSSAGH
jgi:hypothetical protein